MLKAFLFPSSPPPSPPPAGCLAGACRSQTVAAPAAAVCLFPAVCLFDCYTPPDTGPMAPLLVTLHSAEDLRRSFMSFLV